MDLKGKYGLIIPAEEREAKAAAVKLTLKKRNVFGDDSDSDEKGNDNWAKKPIKKQIHGSVQQKQSAQAIKQALVDDPTVYQYDELYDDMEKKRMNSKESKNQEKKPKYIDKLIKSAEKRQQEYDERQERLVQKEREAEGDLYKDKEAFVTGAYRKKMEELEKAKEEQRYKDGLDALVDVTKQKDLSGFYRHLYRQQLDEPEAAAKEIDDNSKKESTEDPEVKIKKEPENISSPNIEDTQHSTRTPERPTVIETKSDPDSKSDRSKKSHKQESNDTKERDKSRHDKREDERRRSRSRETRRHRDDNQRDRNRDDSRDRDRERKQNRSDRERRQDREHERKKDKDRSRRDRDRSHDRKDKREDKDRSHKKERDRDNQERRRDPSTPELPEKKPKIEKKDENSVVEVEKEDIEPQKPRVSIWIKRTVGTVFDEALTKYFARKQANTLQASIVPNHD